MVLTYKHETYRGVTIEETKGVEDIKGTITHVCHEWQQWRGSTVVIMRVYHDLQRSYDGVGDWGQWLVTMSSFVERHKTYNRFERERNKKTWKNVCVLVIMKAKSNSCRNTQKNSNLKKNQVPIDIDEKFRYLGVKLNSYRYT